jgi:hypothetical protein
VSMSGFYPMTLAKNSRSSITCLNPLRGFLVGQGCTSRSRLCPCYLSSQS